ncbi:hypothetical protein A4H97_17800 [Niastella yeongjuensis]|uniref:Beta-lactamase-inhibitor-like PepSY-like domain-containing protein n=1 Tax=Niastella yeongjuensis TaxID=354355 RepID=A0A1V9E1R1_9BACT|nr:hypothetical protein [Niastella yeongjuensis]OQP40068.1 hypothetical protein A4H97_17800 [Niastella yeongjuensis]SEO15706.1 hypothetical protein SAMN05660816_02305 [Niastella yeongjuensis]
MKKTAIFFLALILLNWNTNTIQAQLAKTSIRFDAVPAVSPGMSSATVEEFNANSKAGKSFARKYENATHAKWTQLRDGSSLVHFYIDGIQTKIFYNRKGNETGMMRYYTEHELPADLRQQVKSVYYDFDIFQVTEVTVGNKTVYLVKIKDKSCTKTVRVANGEMDVVEEIENL